MTLITMRRNNTIKLAEHPPQVSFQLIRDCRPSLLALRLPCSGGTLDFAPLLFARRTRSTAGKGYSVDLASYEVTRIPFVQEWATHITERYFQGCSARTLRASFARSREFLDWCDNQNAGCIFTDPATLHSCIVKYSRYLNNAVDKTTISHNHAHCKLSQALYLSAIIFPDSDTNFLLGVKLIPYSKETIKHTTPPTDDELDAFITPLTDLCMSIYKFMNSDRRLPYGFSAGSEFVWAIPAKPALVSVGALEQITPTRQAAAWSHLKSQALKLHQGGTESFHLCLEVVMSILEKKRVIPVTGIKQPKPRRSYVYLPDETDAKHLHRICRVAHDCFLHTFALVTAANQQPITDVIWDKFSVVERGAQNQRVIKNRAKKEINIGFQARFAKEFECYLAIRAFLVGDYEFDYLFGRFVFGEPPRKMGDMYPSQALSTITHFIFPGLPQLNFKQLRAYHLHYKSKEAGISVAARAGGHTELTALQSYSTGHVETNIEEATIFFSAVGDRANQVKKKIVTTSAGGCTGAAINPSTIQEHHTIEPDCRNFLGCLFCQNLFIHMNEQDIRKLWSMLFVIEELRALAISHDEYETYWGPTASRLKFILNKIEKHDEQARKLANQIRTEVYEDQDLDPYWQNKYDMMITIGVL